MHLDVIGSRLERNYRHGLQAQCRALVRGSSQNHDTAAGSVHTSNFTTSLSCSCLLFQFSVAKKASVYLGDALCSNLKNLYGLWICDTKVPYDPACVMANLTTNKKQFPYASPPIYSEKRGQRVYQNQQVLLICFPCPLNLTLRSSLHSSGLCSIIKTDCRGRPEIWIK